MSEMSEKNYRIEESLISDFHAYLIREEKSRGTVEKYLHDVRALAAWLGEREAVKENVAAWKNELLDRNYKPVTVNSMLSALNTFFDFMGWRECRVKFLHIQRRLFRNPERELTRAEYDRLIRTALDQGKERTALLMETICSTGIRVSEVKYITVNALQSRRAEISLKGKIRTILLPGKLCKKLLGYAKKQGIKTGEVFLTGKGKGISRHQIWQEMKSLCEEAQVEPSKVFPHNLRHLFAITWYRACRDIVKLADLLGHSSIETTRIYLVDSGEEHMRQLDQLGLVA